MNFEIIEKLTKEEIISLRYIIKELNNLKTIDYTGSQKKVVDIAECITVASLFNMEIGLNEVKKAIDLLTEGKISKDILPNSIITVNNNCSFLESKNIEINKDNLVKVINYLNERSLFL